MVCSHSLRYELEKATYEKLLAQIIAVKCNY